MKEQGFSLMEVMVALAVVSILFIAINNFGQNILGLNNSASQSLTAGLESRQAVKTMIKELRGLENISAVGTSTITFTLNNQSVTYFLDSSTHMIKREVGGVESTLVSDVVATSTPIFDYYDQNYAGTSTPLTLPTNLTSVSLLKITLTVDKDPNRAPLPLTITSQVTLRNLKNNL